MRAVTISMTRCDAFGSARDPKGALRCLARLVQQKHSAAKSARSNVLNLPHGMVVARVGPKWLVFPKPSKLTLRDRQAIARRLAVPSSSSLLLRLGGTARIVATGRCSILLDFSTGANPAVPRTSKMLPPSYPAVVVPRGRLRRLDAVDAAARDCYTWHLHQCVWLDYICNRFLIVMRPSDAHAGTGLFK